MHFLHSRRKFLYLTSGGLIGWFPLFFILLFTFYGNAQSFEDGFKEINGAKIYYRAIGNGDPILIVHGGPGLDQSYLYPHIKSLAKKFRLVFYDQRLSGKSSAYADTNSISVDAFVEDIESLRQQLSLQRITILAHSFGGLFAVKYALKYPQNVKSLVLVSMVSPNSAENRDSEQILRKRFTTDDSLKRAAILKSEGFKKREASVYNELMKLSFKNQVYKKSYLADLNFELPPDFYQRSLLLQHLRKDISSYNFYDQLKHIHCPALLVYGNYDPLSKFVAKKIIDSLLNAELKIFKKCGHFPFLEKRKQFYNVVAGWNTR
jgi:proline iminopeptidase